MYIYIYIYVTFSLPLSNKMLLIHVHQKVLTDLQSGRALQDIELPSPWILQKPFTIIGGGRFTSPRLEVNRQSHRNPPGEKLLEPPKNGGWKMSSLFFLEGGDFVW